MCQANLSKRLQELCHKKTDEIRDFIKEINVI